MMSSLHSFLSLCLLAACPALAQGIPTPAPLAFDVASVRQSKAGAPQHTNVPLDLGYVYGSISADDTRSAAGGYLNATHQPLWRYIAFAYKLTATQEMALRFSIYSGVPKSGAPFWVTGSFDAPPEFFDISARAPANTSIDQMRLMMQGLLSDRFHLALHTATADAPIFALVLIKPGVPGPDLRPHAQTDSCDGASTAVADLPPVCGVIAHVASTTPGQHYGGRAVSLALLATTLPTMTGLATIQRPVVDQTRLAGLFDFALHFNWTAAGGEDGDNVASFHEALKAQLGLELKSTRGPVSILIIDHVERPSEN
jgi:uncharacterized protein (TIGR03435 family)